MVYDCGKSIERFFGASGGCIDWAEGFLYVLNWDPLGLIGKILVVENKSEGVYDDISGRHPSLGEDRPCAPGIWGISRRGECGPDVEERDEMLRGGVHCC